jgi:hypothetical protein
MLPSPPDTAGLRGGRIQTTPGPSWLRLDTAGAKLKARRVVAPSEGNQARRKGRQQVVAP